MAIDLRNYEPALNPEAQITVQAGSTNATFILSATTDTPGLNPQSQNATGFIKITVAGTSRYIPFYT